MKQSKSTQLPPGRASPQCLPFWNLIKSIGHPLTLSHLTLPTSRFTDEETEYARYVPTGPLDPHSVLGGPCLHRLLILWLLTEFGRGAKGGQEVRGWSVWILGLLFHEGACGWPWPFLKVMASHRAICSAWLSPSRFWRPPPPPGPHRHRSDNSFWEFQLPPKWTDGLRALAWVNPFWVALVQQAQEGALLRKA